MGWEMLVQPAICSPSRLSTLQPEWPIASPKVEGLGPKSSVCSVNIAYSYYHNREEAENLLLFSSRKDTGTARLQQANWCLRGVTEQF